MLKFHYVYRITNIVKNKHYYGIRSTKNIPTDDLGVKYFSSSKDKEFLQDQKQNYQNYKYKIIFIYHNRNAALNMEIVLHNKFDVGINESFYNLSKQTSIGFDRSGITYKHSEETKSKIGLGNKGKYVSKTTRNKLSKIHKNKIISKKHKLQISNKLKGRKHSKEHNEKISSALQGMKKQTYICPHCKHEGKSGVMFRWHFDNCSSRN